MIILDHVTVGLGAKDSDEPVLTSASLVIPSDRRIAFLGVQRGDATTVFNLLAGIRHPREGSILRKATVSFPIGYVGGFVQDLPVRVNVAHLARMYGADVKTVTDFVQRSLNLDEAFERPYEELSRKTQRRLSVVVGFTIPFDVYLMTDKDIESGGGGRRNIGLRLFEERSRTAGMIVATSDLKFAGNYCDMGMILIHQQLMLCDDLQAGYEMAQAAEREKRQMSRRRDRDRNRNRERRAAQAESE
jgi:capsular polysaccharide transport system ATP-binding protein